MRIASLDIRLSTHHQVEERYVRKESLVEGVSSRADAWEPSLFDRFREGNVPEGPQGIRAEGPGATGVPAVGGLDDLARAIEQATGVTRPQKPGRVSFRTSSSPARRTKPRST